MAAFKCSTIGGWHNRLYKKTNSMNLPLCILTLAQIVASGSTAAPAPNPSITINLRQPGKPISPDLFGIFFEDLNYAADGGLYAELIQNRSFEYSPGDHKDWNSLTGWELIQREGAKGSVSVEEKQPLNANNPHYAVLNIETGGAGVGLQNNGFDGIVIKAGDKYDFSVFARQLDGTGASLTLRLESKTGELLGEATLPSTKPTWTRASATIQAKKGADDAHLVLLGKGKGRIALDMVSLFPRKTFHDHPNGLRPDLAQVIADIHPKFMRFPGGCLAHGDGLDNISAGKTPLARSSARLSATSGGIIRRPVSAISSTSNSAKIEAGVC